MKYKQILIGCISRIPGMLRFHALRGTGGMVSSRYCYSVWMRHLVLAAANGLDVKPAAVAELGPGDSLGIGLAALITGSDEYYAFDVVKHACIERNLKIFDEIVHLVENRTAIPGEDEFPNVRPLLDSYAFPVHLLDDARMRSALNKSRIQRIKEALSAYSEGQTIINYTVPWFDSSIVRSESIDMIFSQAVLEHVDDLENAYRVMRLWLKPGGYISHLIDFKCHETADRWNGHWTYSDRMWKLIRGRRPYLLNREPHATHIRLMRQEGFDIVCDARVMTSSSLDRSALAPRFRHLSDDDLTTSASFIQAVKPLAT